MSGYNQQNGAIFDAPAIEARINALDGKGTYNQQNGASLEMAALAYRLALLDGKIAKFQGGTQFDVADLVTRLNALEAGIFTPLQLFAAGEQGAWYDPSDFSTMFQDSAGTTPVTASGQPVGKILDKSGRGNHLIQATTTARPTLQQSGSLLFLLGDGVDDTMGFASGANPLTGATAAEAAWAATNLQPTVLIGSVFGNLGSDPLNYDHEPYNDGVLYHGFASTGRIPWGAMGTGTNPYVLRFAQPGTTLSVFISGVQRGTTTAATFGLNATPPGMFTNQGAFLMNARFFGGVLIGRTMTAAERARVDKYLGAKAGLSL